MPRIEQERLRNSRTYDDTKPAGAVMEATPGDLEIETDLNNVRSQLKRIIDAGGDWFAAVLDGFDLRQIHDKLVAFQTGVRTSGAIFAFTLGAPASGVLTPATIFPGGAGVVAVGPASVTNLGYIAAAEVNFTLAGTLGVGLSEARDAEAILLNRVAILDDATDDNPQTAAGEHIFGLLHVINGTADGAAIGGAGSENLEISFVFYDRTTGVLTATTLPAGSYRFAPVRQRNLFSLTRGFPLAGGSAPEILDPGGLAPKLPIKEYDITAGAPIAADDPLNIQTGVFTGAGARTTLLATFGAVVLPTSGASFRDDSRIKVWVNGQLLSKGASGAANRDVYWVSTTTLAFEFPLFPGDAVYIETPSAY